VKAVVLAVDPGRSKCGVAVLSSEGAVICRDIVETAALACRVRDLLASASPGCLVVGDGTGSAAVIAALHAIRGDTPLHPVDESHTSEMARKRYLAQNPPRGLRRLIPSFLRSPEEPYDDYVAIILAERWLASPDSSHRSE
jgi:RNase H-fold protein (predicted Holliday junction resolvase)